MTSVLVFALGPGLAGGDRLLTSTPAATKAAHWAGRRLQDALLELSKSGLNIIYSSELIRRDMRVMREPSAPTLRLVLEEILAPHGLAVQPGPDDTLAIVPRPRTQTTDDRAIQLGFRERVDVAGRPVATEAADPGARAMAPAEVLATAGAIDNVFRALQVLPGVTGAGLFETKIAVRGGTPDQNLTVMDGVEIHNPFRLFGSVASFNPDTIERFELLAGAFPARYGDRLSSLLVVDTRDGRTQGTGGGASASLSDASGVLEGRLPGPGVGSFLLAGRRTYYDLVAGPVLSAHLPRFEDLQLKLAWRSTRGHALTVTGLRSREGTDSDLSDAADRLSIVTGGANDLLAVNLFTPMGRRATLRSVASVYRFDEALDLDLQGRTDTRVSFDRRQGGSADQIQTLDLRRNIHLRDLALRQELAWAISPRQRLELGGEFHRLQTGWNQELAGDRSNEAANGSSILFGAGLPALVDSRVDSTRVAGFLEYRAHVGRRFMLQPGLRLERAAVGWTTLSPRLQVAVEAGKALRIKAALGLHTQSPGYEKELHSDYFLDLSNPERRTLVPERALHFLLGADWSLGPARHASIEAYYRDFSRLLIGRLETEAETQARLAGYQFPPELEWGLPSHPLITSSPVNAGEGRAFGILTCIRKDALAHSRLNGWVSYSWSRAERTAYGRTYPFDYDRPHALTAVGAFRLSPKLELSATGRLASGLPTTPPRGVLVLGVPDQADLDHDGDRTELIPARDSSRRLIYTQDPGGADTLNSSRLPVYARIDLRLSFRPQGPAGRWLFYLEALNVLNRENASSYDWNIRLDPGAERPRIEVGQGQDGIPLLPTMGVRFRF
jgi:TonB-dependent Receptor Plug Domain/TonB dependent receptor-like, beta-barrel